MRRRKRNRLLRYFRGYHCHAEKSHGEIKTAIKTPRFLYAGICEGEKTGEVEFICGGKVIARADIVARESIAKTAVKKRKFLF